MQRAMGTVITHLRKDRFRRPPWLSCGRSRVLSMVTLIFLSTGDRMWVFLGRLAKISDQETALDEFRSFSSPLSPANFAMYYKTTGLHMPHCLIRSIILTVNISKC